MVTALLDPVLSSAPGDKPGIDLRRLGAMLQVTSAEVAVLAGVHRSSLTRNPSSPDVQRELGLVATILSRATGMFGSRRRFGPDKAGDKKAPRAPRTQLNEHAVHGVPIVAVLRYEPLCLLQLRAPRSVQAPAFGDFARVPTVPSARSP